MSSLPRPQESRHRRRPVADDGGFTLVEVMVAATLLIIGALATLALLDNGADATSVSRQRDVANATAQEMIERATGGRNTLTVDAAGKVVGRNDMTDVDPSSPTTLAGPADRMRIAMDRSGSSSGAVTPATVTTGFTPVNAPQSWSVRRNGTDYTVSYRACTASDAYQSAPGQTLTIAGPYDCSRASHDLGTIGTPVPPTGTEPTKCSLLSFQAATGGTGTGAGTPDPISIGIQLLSLVGIDACLGPNLKPLTSGLCTIIGTGGVVSDLVKGTSGLLGQLKVGGINASLCDPTQIEPSLANALRLTASTTRIAITVRWTDRRGNQQDISRTTVVRRPA